MVLIIGHANSNLCFENRADHQEFATILVEQHRRRQCTTACHSWIREKLEGFPSDEIDI